jgi:hypothetical protein
VADPRLVAGWNEIGRQCVTCVADNSTITYSATTNGGSAAVGKAVNFSADGKTVQLVSDAEAVVGKLLSVESDLMCNVQIGGQMTLPGGTGVSSIALGSKIVGAVDGSANKGYIRAVASGTAAELALARGFCVDDSVTTAIEVFL